MQQLNQLFQQVDSVATSWTLDIQDVISKNMSDDRRTKIAQFVSLAVGLFSIGVSIVMAQLRY